MTSLSVEKIEVSPKFNRALADLKARLSAETASEKAEPILARSIFGPGCLRDGVQAADSVDQAEWEWLYVRLRAESGDLLPELETLRERAGPRDGVVPIALFDIRYRKPGPRLSRAILKASRDDTAIPLPQGPLEALFDSRQAFAASALLPPDHLGFERLPDVHRGSVVRFRLASELWLSNGPKPDRVEVDFGDGEGFRELGWDETHEVDYGGDGAPRITLRASFAEGQRVATFLFRIETPEDRAIGPAGQPSPAGEDHRQAIPAAIPYNGVFYNGVCHIYYGKGNGTRRLRRPILLAEGFPGGANENTIYDILNGRTPDGWNRDAQLADDLRGRGYDVVVLTFNTVGAPIQGNAFVYIAALQWMWGDMGRQGKITAAGGSMGGLIARYALTYAEFGPPEHRVDFDYVDKMITFDSPHTGANVPISVQYTARYFGPDWAPGSLRTLNYPSARQMLTHQIWQKEGKEPITKPEFTAFYAELERMGGGYPTKPKKYAVSNGAKGGAPLAPPEVRALRQWRTHGAGGDRNYEVILQMSPNRTLTQRQEYANCFFANFGYRIIAYVDPGEFFSRDGGAGGYTGHFEETSNQLNKPFSFPGIDMPHRHNCFVPIFSALGVKFSGDAYTGFKASDLKPGQTPFTDWHATETNQWHCTVDKSIRDWILSLFPQQAAQSEVLEAAAV